ncbi:MAG: cation transporter [Clostridia bacterium]|nr:cation transporter [Clostridia bacterium]
MRSDKNILVAFILNLAFSIFELIGGAFTNSVAIISDAIHDMGDAISIGAAYVLERKSKGKPDKNYTYGYLRYSVLGSLITTLILLIGSVLVIYNSIVRIINPVEINYDGMIIFAIVGAVVNFLAAYFTRDGKSLNQKAVNLHMLEDVLGWIVVLVGAIIMRFTDWAIIDPLLSIGVAGFILYHALRNLKEIVDIILEKTPSGIDVDEITKLIKQVDGIIGVHHMHIWSMDGYHNYATMHLVTQRNFQEVKAEVKKLLSKHNIGHVTIECEMKFEYCPDKVCRIEHIESSCGCGHHHHHHGHSH